MKIAITGSHGLVGRHLMPELEAAGHQVVRLVRGAPGPGELHWDPAAGELDGDGLADADGVVNLAGAGILTRRWNDDHKRQILDSRVGATRLVAERLASRPGTVLVSGSAVGAYGERGDEELTETSSRGDDFLSDVCRRWEEATEPAASSGVRVVTVRTGIVLAADGGALKPQLLPFKAGLGARLGSGRQWVSWISIDDEVAAIRHALEHDDLRGPVNLTAPNPVTNGEFTRVLAGVLHRPGILAVPAPVIELALGKEMAHQTVLASQRVLPQALQSSGYRFRHPELGGALHALLRR